MINKKNRWNGDLYKKNSLQQLKFGNHLITEHSFVGTEKILDIGCGDGKISALIAKEKVRNGTVTGLDISDSMIKTAKESFFSIKNLDFICYDAQNFSTDDHYDLITSFTAMHWIPDHHAVWRSIYKHLKIGGKALVCFNPPPRPAEFQKALNETMESSEWYEYFCNYIEPKHMPELTLEEYKLLVMSEGLFILACDCTVTCYTYENKDDFVDSTRSWLPQAMHLQDELGRKFVEDFTVRFTGLSSPEPDGKINLRFNTYKIKAVRLH